MKVRALSLCVVNYFYGGVDVLKFQTHVFKPNQMEMSLCNRSHSLGFLNRKTSKEKPETDWNLQVAKP